MQIVHGVCSRCGLRSSNRSSVLCVEGLGCSLAAGKVSREDLVRGFFLFTRWFNILVSAAAFKSDISFSWNALKNISCILFLRKYWKKRMSCCWPFLPWLASVAGRETMNCFSTGEASTRDFCSVTERHVMWSGDAEHFRTYCGAATASWCFKSAVSIF